mgnify:CR=1 FL=1
MLDCSTLTNSDKKNNGRTSCNCDSTFTFTSSSTSPPGTCDKSCSSSMPHYDSTGTIIGSTCPCKAPWSY